MAKEGEENVNNEMNNHTNVSDDLKYTLLKKPWTPSNHYNNYNKNYFKNDIVVGVRPFLFKWFSIYPWLTYSNIIKVTFCTY